MSRLMSVSLTEAAVVERRKIVTRRTGWQFLTPGNQLTLCRKVMGRRPGEPLLRLAEIEVIDVRREPLDAITAADIEREGVAPMTPAEFVAWFCRTHRGTRPDSTITRIEWRYLSDQPTSGPAPTTMTAPPSSEVHRQDDDPATTGVYPPEVFTGDLDVLHRRFRANGIAPAKVWHDRWDSLDVGDPVALARYAVRGLAIVEELIKLLEQADAPAEPVTAAAEETR